MSRIPDAEIERLKKEISLVRLIESQGYQLEKRGKDFVMRCVFHEESTPSLSISVEKNLYHCFGCNAGGGVIDWVMKTNGVSFTHAVELLRNNAPVYQAKPQVARSTTRHLPSLAAADEQALLHQVLEHYHSNLTNNATAQAYLASRGLTHPELISTFKLGVSDRTLGYRLPPARTQAGDAVRGQLQQIGILRESGHEHLTGSLVIPILGIEHAANAEHASRILQLYGRRLQPDKRQGSIKHLYLPRPMAGVWNEAALIEHHDIILCEALIDALTFWCAGYQNVISAYGVNGFTPDHWQALKHHGTRRVWIAYDRDEAGNRAADELAPQLMEVGIEAWRVQFPKGMDANSYAQHVAPADKSLGLVLQQAQWCGKGKTPSVVVPERTLAELPNEPSLAALTATNESAVTPIATLAASLEPLSTKAAEAALQEEVPLQKESSSFFLAAGTEVTNRDDKTIDAQAPTQTNVDELNLSFGPRHWRIKGFKKNLSPELMKVNVQVREKDNWHIDTLDMYAAKARAAYIKQASVELDCPEEALKRELGQVLLKLEQMQDAAIQKTLAPQEATPVVAEEDMTEALAWLSSVDLIARLEADLAACGVVGEADNLLAGYLAAVSRKLDTPLAVLIQSSSAAGKSSLMDAVLNLMPTEERLQYSAMTGQSLYYLGETNLQHKILAIAEEEGVRQAAYALKLLQSDGELTIASTGKDEATGELVTKQYTVKGPVMLMLTTTAIDIDEELLNRCLVLTINETREQTQAIHARQRQKQTLDGLLSGHDKKVLTALHQNVQRLLKPYAVVNPYAEQLTFLSDKTRTRRDHMKYLTLIQAIAFLHQYQRPLQKISHRGQMLEYVEVIPADIELANRLAHRILGRTLDEMPPQTRRLLKLIHALVQQRVNDESIKTGEVRFTRRDIREATGWSDSQLKVHCLRLMEMEYLLAHGGNRGHLMSYELLYDEKMEDEKRFCGLINVEELTYDERKFGLEPDKFGSQERKSGSSLGQVCPKFGGGLGQPVEREAAPEKDVGQTGADKAPNAVHRAEKTDSGVVPVDVVAERQS